MCDTRNFKKEYDAFLQRFPYQTAAVDGIKVRYQYGGKKDAPVLLFFNGLEMQEMWMPYAEKLRDKSTLTVDSNYVRDIQKERFSTPFLLLLLKLVPAKTEMKLLLKKSAGFLKCESEADQSYGRGFYETVASDLNYKKRFIHSFRCVYMLKDYPPFQANDFEYLRGRILILLPENDIFKKEDQNRFAQLFRKLDAEIRIVPGGHVGFIVQSERCCRLRCCWFSAYSVSE